MSETIKLPFVGPQKTRTVALIGGGFVVIVGVAYYRHKNAGATTADSTDVAGLDTDSIDPATGFAYGSDEDAAALTQQAGYVSTGGASGSSDSGSGGVSQSTGFVNNAQWSQAAIEYLTDAVGIDAAPVSAALGKYLSGSPVDNTEKGYILQAIASEGQPPQSGTNGYPPSIKEVAGTTTSKPATSTKLATPSLRVSQKIKSAKAHGKVHAVQGAYTVQWTPVKGAGYYRLYNHDNLVYQGTATSFHKTGTNGGTNFHVYAYPAAGDTAHVRSNASNVVSISV